MIQTTLTNLLVLYLGGAFCLVALLALAGVYLRRRREGRRRRRVVVCQICGHVRDDTSGAKVVRCPRCESLNERVALREI